MATVTILPDPRAQRQYPDSRVSTSTGYASSDSTLAESLPSSPVNQPPPYRFGYTESANGYPPQYNDSDTASVKEKTTKKNTKKKLMVRLMTSILITVIVCLIVAAVVGRIHDKQTGKADAEAAAKASASTSMTKVGDKLAEATRITIGDASPTEAEATPTMASPLTTLKTSVIKQSATPSRAVMNFPTGTSVAGFECPYIDNDESASSRQCQLRPLPAKAALSQAQLLSATMHHLDGCDVARGKYRQDGVISYHCAVSCGKKPSLENHARMTDDTFDCT